MLRKTLLTAAAALCAAPASAAEPRWNTMSVDLPDGSVAQVQYVGDIAPRVTISVPAETFERTEDRVANGGIPRARRAIPRPETLPPHDLAPYPYPTPPRAAPTPQFVFPGDTPWGTNYSYAVITTNPDGTVCTQRTEWTSRGWGREPKIVHTDTGDGCAALAAWP